MDEKEQLQYRGIPVGAILSNIYNVEQDNSEEKHGAPPEDVNSSNKRPKVDNDMNTEMSEVPKKWSDVPHLNDDHQEEYFKAKNSSLAGKYGEGIITATYIEHPNGNIQYDCQLCCSKVFSTKNLEAHCRGAKHLKKVNLMEIHGKDGPIFMQDGKEGKGRGKEEMKDRGHQKGEGNRGSERGRGRGWKDGQGSQKGQDVGHDRGMNLRGEQGSDWERGRGRDWEQGRGWGRGQGRDWEGRRGRDWEGGRGRDWEEGREREWKGGQSRERERWQGREWEGGRGRDEWNNSIRSRDDYYGRSQSDYWGRFPFDEDDRSRRGGPYYRGEKPYSDRQRYDDRNYDRFDSVVPRRPLRTPPPPKIKTPSPPPIRTPVPPPAPRITPAESLANGTTGLLLKKLASCSVKTESDEDVAMTVLVTIIKSLKQFKDTRGSKVAVHLLDDIAVKLNVMKGIRAITSEAKQK
ncbi:hypothetical protein Pmani_026612 [Petrolisthes manimaculis]|uniref:C2H2-type domain-containing protein n=1 Tax=Petrolisthes manimaculis TaxID=1843537 RepID=A0AAE1TXN9_9EUCA|nr:hypothetical protein Pmani_026612 [Petrolisthes manimaculis]